MISETVGNLLIFRKKLLDLGPKSVCVVEITIYVYWTCININEGVRSKMAFFVFRPTSQDQKGLSDTNKLLNTLACELILN